MYQSLSFDEFEKNFINQPDRGYLSVWFEFINPKEDSDYEEYLEPEDTKPKRTILKMDMVLPSRLLDGQITFYEVEIHTKEQYSKSVKYLREAQNLLKESLDKNFTSGDETITEIDLN